MTLRPLKVIKILQLNIYLLKNGIKKPPSESGTRPFCFFNRSLTTPINKTC